VALTRLAHAQDACDMLSVTNANYADCNGLYQHQKDIVVDWAPLKPVYKHLTKDRYIFWSEATEFQTQWSIGSQTELSTGSSFHASDLTTQFPWQGTWSSGPIVTCVREPDYSRVSSENCEYIGMKTVRSEEACEIAATKLGLSDTSAVSFHLKSLPRGCIYSSKNRLWWNDPTSYGGQWSDASVPCGTKYRKYEYDCLCTSGRASYIDVRSSETCNDWKIAGMCNDDFYGPKCLKTCGKCD